MFCKNCGKEINDNAVICPYCGVATGKNMPAASGSERSTGSSTNGFAIAGFVLSFFIPLLGLIFSIVGLRKADECGSGRGLAIAGIVISILDMVLAIIIVASGSCMGAAALM